MYWPPAENSQRMYCLTLLSSEIRIPIGAHMVNIVIVSMSGRSPWFHKVKMRVRVDTNTR
eukprot:scaffold36244_cov46-Cyclotella_meneghiniana.AAC.3